MLNYKTTQNLQTYAFKLLTSLPGPQFTQGPKTLLDSLLEGNVECILEGMQ